MFSDFATAYLFLGGTGGGALIVLALLECANARRRFSGVRITSGIFSASAELSALTPPTRSQRVRAKFALPDDVLRNAWVICAVTLALGILFLFMDLGRPERVLALLAHPTLSAITVGAYALMLALACATAFCVLALMDVYALSVRGIYVFAAICMVAGTTVILYTGILLTQSVSVLFWMTPLVPALFALSSLSCGIACVMLGAAFATTRQVFSGAMMRLGNIDTALIAGEALVLAAWLIWGLATAGPNLSAQALVTGPLAVPFWLGLAGIGLILPTTLEQYLNYSNHKTQTLMIAALVLFGGVMLRICVVGAGGFDITQTGAFTALQM